MHDSLSGHEPWIHLLGRSPIEELAGFALQADPLKRLSMNEIRATWLAGLTAVEALAAADAGAANGAVLTDLPAELGERAEKFLDDPVIRAEFSSVKSTIAMVPLGKAVV